PWTLVTFHELLPRIIEWLGKLVQEPICGSRRLMSDHRKRPKPYTLNHWVAGSIPTRFTVLYERFTHPASVRGWLALIVTAVAPHRLNLRLWRRRPIAQPLECAALTRSRSRYNPATPGRKGFVAPALCTRYENDWPSEVKCVVTALV